MVEHKDVQNAAQTTFKKIDEIDFTPIKKGRFGIASDYASSEVVNLMREIIQELRNLVR